MAEEYRRAASDPDSPADDDVIGRGPEDEDEFDEDDLEDEDEEEEED